MIYFLLWISHESKGIQTIINIGENNYQDSMELVIHLFHILHISLMLFQIPKLIMNMFVLSLDFIEDEIFDWYEKLGELKISSISYFFKIFLENWLPLHAKVKCEKGCHRC